MIGTTHQVSTAPPVSAQSTAFIIASMATMATNDMPTAVRKAVRTSIWREWMNASRAMEVSSPFTMASVKNARVGQGIPVNWKKAMVPKSPMAQPSKHQAVLFDAWRQVRRERQSIEKLAVMAVMSLPVDASL